MAFHYVVVNVVVLLAKFWVGNSNISDGRGYQQTGQEKGEATHIGKYWSHARRPLRN